MPVPLSGCDIFQTVDRAEILSAGAKSRDAGLAQAQCHLATAFAQLAGQQLVRREPRVERRRVFRGDVAVVPAGLRIVEDRHTGVTVLDKASERAILGHPDLSGEVRHGLMRGLWRPNDRVHLRLAHEDGGIAFEI